MKSSELLSFLLFISGYALGRIDSILDNFKKGNKCESFVDRLNKEEKQEKTRKKLLIDDTKFVTKVSTDSFQKNSELGIKTEVNDNIENETAKLVKLKKKKG